MDNWRATQHSEQFQSTGSVKGIIRSRERGRGIDKERERERWRKREREEVIEGVNFINEKQICSQTI